MATQSKPTGRVPDLYLELVLAFPLRPIRTENENEEAIEVVASLGRREPLDPAERDYLDVLVTLIQQFETEQYPMPPVRGVEMLRHLIEARGLTQAQTAKGAGLAESAFSEMLAGKRKMAIRHVKALAQFFNVPTDLIIGD